MLGAFSVEIGHVMLIMAFAATLLSSTLPVAGWRLGDQRLMRSADSLAIIQFVFMLFSFLVLMKAYVASDFSVKNVWENAHSQQPLLYKITGTWGNHEGSMLLWVLILGLFGASVPVFGRRLPLDLRAIVIAVQSWIAASFLLFIIMTSNPFTRLSPAPLEGQDLNPVLQDIGLAIHPPLLYIGYVGFSMTFAFAVAALMLGRLDQAWAKWVRPWTLAAWMFLTIGIAMGSYWAYYELGWGGWWFWDPVENASFMPWLVGTALLHSAIMVEKRNALRIWTILLAILTFSLSLLGTFLVRSGVLTSVHSFATDPTRGIFILCILMVFVGGSLALFALRARTLTGRGLFAPISREGALVVNNIFLTASCGTVLFGTLYPLLYEAVSGNKISVGAPFFNYTMVPLYCLLLVTLPFGPFLSWKRGDLRAAAQRLTGVAILAALIGFGIYLALDDKASMAPLGLILGFWLVLGAIYEPLWRAKFLRGTWTQTLRRLAGLPRAMWGSALAHMGVGLCVIGIVCVSAWQTETVQELTPGQTISGGGYDAVFEGVEPIRGPNYGEDIANLSLYKDGEFISKMTPSKRIYIASGTPTTEAAIKTRGLSHVYLSLSEVRTDNSVLIYMYYKPFVLLIWLGALVMFLGGGLSLADRRLRIGVPKRAETKLSSNKTVVPAE